VLMRRLHEKGLAVIVEIVTGGVRLREVKQVEQWSKNADLRVVGAA
jgi:hypothetical protein